MAVKLTHQLNGAQIEVADDKAAQFWLERGYRAESPAPAAKKAAAKRPAAKK